MSNLEELNNYDFVSISKGFLNGLRQNAISYK